MPVDQCNVDVNNSNEDHLKVPFLKETKFSLYLQASFSSGFANLK